MAVSIKKISFVEVNVLPSNGERYYQLFKDGVCCPFVYSESHLLHCFCVLEKSHIVENEFGINVDSSV